MKQLVKYRLLLFVLLSGAFFLITYSLTLDQNVGSSVQHLTENFKEKEKKLNLFLDQRKSELNHQTDFAAWKHHQKRTDLYLHVFRNDSLVYWNTNVVPIRQFADIHFPSDGVIQLQNGWYYVKTVKQDSYTICASFLIKREFPYENKDLINGFENGLNVPFDATVSIEKGNGFEVKSSSGQYLFSVIPFDTYEISEAQQILILTLLLILISTILILLYSFTENKPWYWSVATILFAAFLRYLSFQISWYGEMADFTAFQPDLYASSELFPNFCEYLINIILLIFFGAIIHRLLAQSTTKKWNKTFALFGLLSSFLIWYFVIAINHGLIENSSIPMIVDRLFSLNVYSILAIVSIASLLYGFYKFSSTAINACKQSALTPAFIAVTIFISGVFFMLLEISIGNEMFVSSLFPMILLGLLTFRAFNDKMKFSLGMDILLLVLFSGVAAINLTELNQRKERSDRVLYANQLATDQDVSTEMEYSILGPTLTSDAFLQKFISSPKSMGVSDFEDLMERRFFKGYWERYEMSFSLFDKDHNSLIIDDSQNTRFEDLDHIIEHHGTPSEISENIYYIGDNTEQYSYIIRQILENKDGTKAVLFCGLRSKKIPEEIGFPRLLISSNANVLEPLENYSIARYHNNELITRYGNFNYPTDIGVIHSWRNGSGFVDKDGYDHYLLNTASSSMVILSSKAMSSIHVLTSFSYLFCFFGLLLIPVLFRSINGHHVFKKTLNLAARIQFVLIALIFVALLGFGWGSGVFIRDQYNDYTNSVVREKMNSVDKELKSKLGSKSKLDISVDGSYMEYLLKKFSKVFVTDINLYDRNGILLASSRPRVFNYGLVSEQMNPDAFFAVSIDKKSEFIHQENIGELAFSSAYQPFYNSESQLIGYMNLQHFGQQKDFENQIQNFLVSIVNVFMLLLAVSVILAIFISNWVTAPLRLLQESFAGVRFGEFNQKIDYKKDDEIGALVQDYNRKLEELEYAAEQLAQSERESAWREMAKQVAHEIKNPLTPMKLSIQQLLRVYDPQNPSSAQKLEKVANSLIEQIDALTAIANEFSNFAKLPKPNEEVINLLPLIEGVVEMFLDEQHCKISINTNLNEVKVQVDRDQMLRVFNNLIKNAIQAIPEDREGQIIINIQLSNSKYEIRVSDNGTGIPVEEQSKIFVPYFTTKSTGTGLGLAMVRQIIESHRGTIDFETEQDKGTTFILTLPSI